MEKKGIQINAKRKMELNSWNVIDAETKDPQNPNDVVSASRKCTSTGIRWVICSRIRYRFCGSWGSRS